MKLDYLKFGDNFLQYGAAPAGKYHIYLVLNGDLVDNYKKTAGVFPQGSIKTGCLVCLSP